LANRPVVGVEIEDVGYLAQDPRLRILSSRFG
jgi:hypothetical protein